MVHNPPSPPPAEVKKNKACRTKVLRAFFMFLIVVVTLTFALF